jgi:hypothetical protein
MKATTRSDFIVRNVRLNGHLVRIREPRTTISFEEFMKRMAPILKRIR